MVDETGVDKVGVDLLAELTKWEYYGSGKLPFLSQDLCFCLI